MPARMASGGKALLAELSERELEKLYRDPQLGENSNYLDEDEFTRLRRDLTQIREKGFAVNFEETEQGVAAVGIALHDRYGQGIGALTVSTGVARFGRQMRSSLLRLVVAAKNEIEQDLAQVDLGPGSPLG